MIEIARLHSLPPDLETLRAEATRQGFGFMNRLVTDWISGANMFNGAGECFLGASTDGLLVGVGGLNIDPYLRTAGVGRIRHVYVLDAWRHKGIGRALIERLLGEAPRAFGEVRLRTASEEAAGFYLRCGFSPADDPNASHSLRTVPSVRAGNPSVPHDPEP